MRSTEKDSLYQNLEQMSVLELLNGINQEDQKVAIAVNQEIKAIEKLVVAAVKKMQDGGRIFYIGAGTSGRLGILDASELPPTFGADPNWVVGMIAGGDKAIRKAVEFAEDDEEQAFIDLKEYHISSKDFVIGIAASGTTPYVIGGLKICQSQEVSTACITCNSNAPVLEFSDFPICVEVGPEFVTGSTRMKAGTAQKLVLNMISTSIMIRLGRVKGNKMVDMQLSNNKLADRGVRMLMSETGLDYDAAHKLLKKHENVRSAINSLKS